MSELEELQVKNVLEALRTNLQLAKSQADSLDSLHEISGVKDHLTNALEALEKELES